LEAIFMHHTPRNRSVQPAVADLSPLEALEAAFVSLSRGIRPVTLPAALLSEQPVDGRVPVDEVRSRLGHPSCRPELRDRVWREVVLRARAEGEPWTTVAAGFAVPGLRRILARLPRLAFGERGELEQEVLTALAVQIAEVELGDPHIVHRVLRAVDRAAHRHEYRRRTSARRLADKALEDAVAAVPGPDEEWSATGSEADEYTVLARAIDEGLVDYASAELIARTRLEGTRVEELACELGRSRRAIFRQRSAAEQALGQALREGRTERPNE
jgi:hypothetical protein